MNGIDRRQHKRHKTEILASIHTKEGNVPATIKDIGSSGFGVVLEKEIPLGSRVMIELKFTGEYVIRGIVKWASQITKGQNVFYTIGIEAENIIWMDLKAVAFSKWDDLIEKIISEAVSQ